MRIEILSTRAMTEEERAEAWVWLRREFGADADDFEWDEPDFHLWVWDGERRIGHIDITERAARAGEQAVRLGGIGGVITLPEYRRRGIATQALRRAAEFIHRERQVDFGLLICRQSLCPFYAGLGWQAVAGPLVFAQSSGPVTFDDPVMVLPCTRADWPPGTIDLCGRPW